MPSRLTKLASSFSSKPSPASTFFMPFRSQVGLGKRKVKQVRFQVGARRRRHFDRSGLQSTLTPFEAQAACSSVHTAYDDEDDDLVVVTSLPRRTSSVASVKLQQQTPCIRGRRKAAPSLRLDMDDWPGLGADADEAVCSPALLTAHSAYESETSWESHTEASAAVDLLLHHPIRPRLSNITERDEDTQSVRLFHLPSSTSLVRGKRLAGATAAAAEDVSFFAYTKPDTLHDFDAPLLSSQPRSSLDLFTAAIRRGERHFDNAENEPQPFQSFQALHHDGAGLVEGARFRTESWQSFENHLISSIQQAQRAQRSKPILVMPYKRLNLCSSALKEAEVHGQCEPFSEDADEKAWADKTPASRRTRSNFTTDFQRISQAGSMARRRRRKGLNDEQ